MSSIPGGLKGALRGDWPVFMCGFRPFFILTGASAVVMVLAWLLMLRGLVPAGMPGGSLLWHGHELLFGFVTAAIAGFVLTAVPEFTRTPIPSRRALVQMTLLWLAARLAYLLAGAWPALIGLWPAALLNLALWVLLLREVLPRVWNAPERRHVSFAWAIAALALLQLGFFVAAGAGGNPLAWLYLSVGMVMVLIIIATSRVSMSVVNGLVEHGHPDRQQTEEVGYLARPPRRNLAIVTILICSMTEFIFGHDVITGWTALAAAAAMLNLLNDWHIGRALFTRWALMLYASYWLIALGYALMGAAWLGAPLLPSSGRHLLMAGAMGLSIFAIMMVAGRIHAGLWLDRRPWQPITATLLVLAALLRAASGMHLFLPWMSQLQAISGLLWAGCFAAYLAMNWSALSGPRTDGQEGCAEPLAAGEEHQGGCSV
ncbi:NnrS family protein [Halopseudomonas xiamenensis]|uniref:NnrS family protein n=1 Tax=Halopseudomonas xiamenensis TaxID=157792 RepID=UPI001624F447|nr:NnrS family protein [Halopseudomonas xiamenensis]